MKILDASMRMEEMADGRQGFGLRIIVEDGTEKAVASYWPALRGDNSAEFARMLRGFALAVERLDVARQA